MIDTNLYTVNQINSRHISYGVNTGSQETKEKIPCVSQQNVAHVLRPSKCKFELNVKGCNFTCTLCHSCHMQHDVSLVAPHVSGKRGKSPSSSSLPMPPPPPSSPRSQRRQHQQAECFSDEVSSREPATARRRRMAADRLRTREGVVGGEGTATVEVTAGKRRRGRRGGMLALTACRDVPALPLTAPGRREEEPPLKVSGPWPRHTKDLGPPAPADQGVVATTAVPLSPTAGKKSRRGPSSRSSQYMGRRRQSCCGGGRKGFPLSPH